MPALRLTPPPSWIAPIDLLSLFLDVDAQLIAILLLNLLISELFGLVDSAIELRNQTLSPTLRSANWRELLTRLERCRSR